MRFRKAKKRLDAVVQKMIAEHRREGVDRGDLLSMLLASRDDEADHSGMTDTQLRDEVLTIFLAGYETVANALAWTWLLLGQNPVEEARFHAELDEVLGDRLPTLDDLPSLRYTEMVFAESMRLYPPAWAMGRQATKDVEMGPYRLPSGTYFFFSQYIMHRIARALPRSAAIRSESFHVGAESCAGEIHILPFWRRRSAVHRRGIRLDGRGPDPGDIGPEVEPEACARTAGRCAAKNYA